MMLIDFSPVEAGQLLSDFAQSFTQAQLRAATNASLDLLSALTERGDNHAVTFVPYDPQADDPHAVPGEEHLGWTFGHVVVHATASSEEYATFSSLLSRGVAPEYGTRLRYETPWRTVTTKMQVLQRIEESRRIRLALLETWPDQPQENVLRNISEKYMARFGPQNYLTAFVQGLYHESQHYDQLRNVLAQAQAAEGLAEAPQLAEERRTAEIQAARQAGR